MWNIISKKHFWTVFAMTDWSLLLHPTDPPSVTVPATDIRHLALWLSGLICLSQTLWVFFWCSFSTATSQQLVQHTPVSLQDIYILEPKYNATLRREIGTDSTHWSNTKDYVPHRSISVRAKIFKENISNASVNKDVTMKHNSLLILWRKTAHVEHMNFNMNILNGL